MKTEKIKQAIEELKQMQGEKVNYAELMGASATFGSRYVFDDPLDYAIETAIQALHNELARADGCGWCKRFNRPDKWDCIPMEYEGYTVAIDTIILPAEFCPVCGKNLIEED